MTKTILAPYGSFENLRIATKVGDIGKTTAPLAPYGSLRFLPIAVKVGEGGKGAGG